MYALVDIVSNTNQDGIRQGGLVIGLEDDEDNFRFPHQPSTMRHRATRSMLAAKPYVFWSEYD